jgi:hypothetical protein
LICSPLNKLKSKTIKPNGNSINSRRCSLFSAHAAVVAFANDGRFEANLTMTVIV